MEQLNLLAGRKKKPVRLTKNAKIIKTIISAIQAKKGSHIVSLDLRKIPEAVSDFFIICEATTSVQIKAIADFVADEVKKQTGETPYRQEGYQAAQWILIDFVNVVVHVMLPENRKFYKLEEMWSDASAEDHND